MKIGFGYSSEQNKCAWCGKLTLEQAIAIATQAHEGQWCNTEPINTESVKWCSEEHSTEVLFPYIIPNGNKIFFLENDLVMQRPYITHPLAVMEMMDTEENKIVAVLHDIFEGTTAELHANNCKYSVSFDNIEYQIPHQIWSALSAFKEKGHYQSYVGYIKNIALNKIATKVKMADIVHNLSCSTSEHAKEKYLKAITVLLNSL